ncbi:hypothetical protein I317_01000 [Kwoniella heveanensis CBS 569]|nr:hypothetical protein I317_01000 [Kwoniella heveanensis CBS 569]
MSAGSDPDQDRSPVIAEQASKGISSDVLAKNEGNDKDNGNAKEERVYHEYHNRGDIYFISTDKVYFVAERKRLASASEVFKDMFAVVQPVPGSSDTEEERKPCTSTDGYNEGDPISLEVSSIAS